MRRWPRSPERERAASRPRPAARAPFGRGRVAPGGACAAAACGATSRRDPPQSSRRKARTWSAASRRNCCSRSGTIRLRHSRARAPHPAPRGSGSRGPRPSTWPRCGSAACRGRRRGHPEGGQRVVVHGHAPRQPAVGVVLLTEPVECARAANAFERGVQPERGEDGRIDRGAARAAVDRTDRRVQWREIEPLDKIPDQSRSMVGGSNPSRSTERSSSWRGWGVLPAGGGGALRSPGTSAGGTREQGV